MRALFSLLIASCFLSVACQDKVVTESSSASAHKPETKAISMTNEVTIKIGEEGEQWLKRYPGLVTTHQPTPNATVYRAN